MPAGQVVTDFHKVYAAEHREIRGSAAEAREPSTADGMTGLALSGGGIRSASFCLGVMQALNAAGVLKTFDYLSTVSGGGYIGSSMTVAMSAAARANGDGWHFPFGKTGQEVGETDETRHLRDNSRYLLQQGMWSAISAGVIYLRGITMNVLIVLPFLLVAAALLVLFKPDTQALAGATALLARLSSHWPFSIAALLILGVLLIVYAVGVSVSPIQRKGIRTGIARFAVVVLVVCIVPVIFEIHFALLRVMFGAEAMGIATPVGPPDQDETHWFDAIGHVVAAMTPVVLAILPFVRQIAQKAVTAATESFGDAAAKWVSRVILIVVAAIVPLILWISVLQLAYWGIGITDCIRPEQAECAAWGGDNWRHAPALLDSSSQLVGIEFASRRGAVLAYLVAAAVLVAFWLILNVNANSLHQLYRDRLGSAFLFGRNAAGALESADRFLLSDIVPGASPYHLINAALNLPGSPFANRRGRNADFFIFSKCYVGSEATGYVDTQLAEKATDGLNVGTAMAISGAAAAPNMGMASMRPLSATIALLNVRLGRWIRHPLDIVRYADAGLSERWWRGSAGPTYLLREAFFKSGTAITERRPDDTSWAGFLFLTDGGHIENLGIYELLRRRCSLIVAVDAEADPAYTSNSLIQLQRFARIDLGTRIVMDWEPVGARAKEVSKEIAAAKRDPAHGPHVALGLIDYPPLEAGGDRQRGVLVYVKSSLSGDENDYVMAYKARNPAFPQESTMEQLFSEEQFEAYRSLGEHIGRRLCDGTDPVTVPSEARSFVLDGARAGFPNLMPKS
ncbi:patatin-like phospholipase family protein [Bradyrhizobium diazoefficiens]|nr:patatin-like phospholipase family protein [Bradyrhizobium diazoefficiens]